LPLVAEGAARPSSTRVPLGLPPWRELRNVEGLLLIFSFFLLGGPLPLFDLQPLELRVELFSFSPTPVFQDSFLSNLPSPGPDTTHFFNGQPPSPIRRRARLSVRDRPRLVCFSGVVMGDLKGFLMRNRLPPSETFFFAAPSCGTCC